MLDSLLTNFATRHSVDLRNLPDPECEGIRWIVRCTDALDSEYRDIPENVLASDPAVGVLRHLLARCAERAEAAVIAFATASGSASEGLSRAAIEAAVTIAFILLEPRPRLAAYFRHHVDDVDRQIRLWQVATTSLPEAMRAIHTVACEHRVLANQEMRAFVERIEKELVESQPPMKWPPIAERFDALRDALTYRTVYARLCAETHFDAEEVLLYTLGSLGGEIVMEQMALETIGFSRLMLAIATCYYLRAIGAYATRYNMPNTVRECRNGLRSMDQLAETLSEHVGGIPKAG